VSNFIFFEYIFMPVSKKVVEEKQFTFDREGKELQFSVGKLAPQADGAVTIRL
jgi:hypothetical protein